MAAVPDLMPVLSRGKHKHPSKGACFMEYTALLAGEPFSDAPACVDRELATVLRHANDLLSDRDRQRLIPLLGRAIGLAVPPAVSPAWQTLDADVYESAVVPYAQATVALHRRVSALFMSAIGVTPTPEDLRRFDEGREVDLLFWWLLHVPVRARGKAASVERMIERLHLLHGCYEQAMTDLELPRYVPGGIRPEVAPPLPEPRPAAPAEFGLR